MMIRFHALTLAALLAAVPQTTTGFTTLPQSTKAFPATASTRTHLPLYATVETNQEVTTSSSSSDSEIERLQSMAQKLRAEAASLEAERAQEMAKAAQHAFEKFDVNKDGEISLEELKQGLEKVLKTELPDERVQKLMEGFDVSGDGKLQLDEFVGVDKFRSKLEALARDEKQQALDAAKTAQKEAEMSKLLEAKMSMLNDGAPTNRDKIVSLLPYLFPLLDSLQFGRFLMVDNADNPFVLALAVLYGLYRSIPFSGFLSFLALNVLSGNPGINRLVRFNMQQAIFLDIALFFPGLIAAAVGLVAGNAIPADVAALGSNAIFATLLLTIAYASVSSLLGVTPNKIPLISNAVEDRMPSIDMFDDEGRFIPKNERKNDDEQK